MVLFGADPGILVVVVETVFAPVGLRRFVGAVWNAITALPSLDRRAITPLPASQSGSFSLATSMILWMPSCACEIRYIRPSGIITEPAKVPPPATRITWLCGVPLSVP